MTYYPSDDQIAQDDLDSALEALGQLQRQDDAAMALLFDPGQTPWIGKIEGKPGRFMTVHPVASAVAENPNGVGVTAETVTAYHTLFAELDLPEVGREEQVARIRARGVPYTLLVWSGGKSVHIHVRLRDPIPKDEWKERQRHFLHSLKVIGADQVTTSPANRCRVPGYLSATRQQDVIELGERRDNDAVWAWLDQFERPPQGERAKVGENTLEDDLVILSDRHGERTVAEWREYLEAQPEDARKVPYCHSPFRDDRRQSGFLSLTESGRLFYYDSATGESYYGRFADGRLQARVSGPGKPKVPEGRNVRQFGHRIDVHQQYLARLPGSDFASLVHAHQEA